MKKILNGVVRHNKISMPLRQRLNNVSFFCLTLVIAIIFTSCKKQNSSHAVDELQMPMAKNSQASVLNFYTSLSGQTAWELQQARAATARYRNFDNAIKDGYVDINVIVPEMGYHYLRADILDTTFDYKNPEILVYNKEQDGSLQLVAIEYAVPINLSPNTAPEGFTGTDDVWDRNTGFGLWLLHAWVWNYNPSGVFNPTNPSVHLH